MPPHLAVQGPSWSASCLHKLTLRVISLQCTRQSKAWVHHTDTKEKQTLHVQTHLLRHGSQVQPATSIGNNALDPKEAGCIFTAAQTSPSCHFHLHQQTTNHEATDHDVMRKLLTSTKIKRQHHAKTYGIETLTLAVAAQLCQTTSNYTFLEPQLERDARKLQRICSISHHQCCKQSAWRTNHMENRKRGDRH